MTHTRSIHRRQALRATQLTDLARLIRQAAVGAALQADDALPPLRVPAAAAPSAPAQLARAAEPAQRTALAATYEQYLRCYRSAASRLGESDARDDAGRALAYFVAVNLQALHGVEPNDDMLQALERQLRATARRCADWDHASLAQRQFFFEQMAISGVQMAAALSRTDPAAREQARSAARRYLQQVLGLDADALALGPSGLVARTPEPARSAATAAA